MKIFLTLVIFSVTQVCASVYSTNWSAKRKEIHSRSAGSVSRSIMRRNQRASEFMAKDDYARAIKIYQGITTASRQNFEIAQAYNNLGLSYARIDKYKQAIKSFEKALSMNALPLGPTLQSMYSLAQIQSMNKGDKKAMALMNGWFALVKKKTPGALVFTATLYKKNNNLDKALSLVEEAISLTSKPNEQWLVFAVALHYEKKNFDKDGTCL